MTATWDLVRELAGADSGLAVVSVLRPDGTISSSVVNAGVLPHPGTGNPVVGLVVRGNARKLDFLRERPRTTVVFRAGWRWVSVEGGVDIVAPGDGVDPEYLRVLLRDVFLAAGGSHEDFDEYDRVMLAERRAAVLVHPERLVSNPGT